MLDNIKALSEKLQGQLPGITIQKRMSPVEGNVDMYYKIPKNARLAAVLALLIPIENEWHLTLIKRPAHPKDLHAGQISFPGGGLENQDDSFEACATRETFEEVGVPQEQINIIGSLTKLYVYASNNLVYPYVGYLQRKPLFRLNEREVEKVITVPLSYFENKSIIKYTELIVRGYKLPKVPYYDVHGEVLWGATAMMISELLYLLNINHN